MTAEVASAAMAFRDGDEIWYASYGSNCAAARFTAYLTGGRAEGATRAERGARDPSPPRATAAHWFDGDVRFLGDADKWGGGGVAFLAHGGGGPSPGRRYLITKGQFDDVAAQESRRETTPLPLHELEPGVVTPIGRGAYDGLLRGADIDGIPVVTFTSPTPALALAPNAPSAAYLATLLRGLLEVHETPLDDLVAAIRRDPAVARGWSAAAMASLV